MPLSAANAAVISFIMQITGFPFVKAITAGLPHNFIIS